MKELALVLIVILSLLILFIWLFAWWRTSERYLDGIEMEAREPWDKDTMVFTDGITPADPCSDTPVFPTSDIDVGSTCETLGSKADERLNERIHENAERPTFGSFKPEEDDRL